MPAEGKTLIKRLIFAADFAALICGFLKDFFEAFAAVLRLISPDGKE